MKTIVLYHPNSEHARRIEEYVHNFGERDRHSIELVSLETREGANLAAVYDIVRYPAVMVIDDSGRLHKEWQGTELPLMDEVAAYLVA